MFFLGKYLGEKFLVHRINVSLTLWKTSRHFSKVGILFYTHCRRVVLALYHHRHLVLLDFLNFIKNVEHLSFIYMVTGNIFLINMCFQIIWAFLMRFFVFLFFIIMSPLYILNTSFFVRYMYYQYFFSL